MIFASLGGNRGFPSVNVAMEKNVDSTTEMYHRLRTNPALKFADPAKKDIEDELRKGRLTAIIDIKPSERDTGYVINLRTSSASERELPNLQSILEQMSHRIEQEKYPDRKTFLSVSRTRVPGRAYKLIDFMLPGMIGFSLIGSAVFGIAFSFYALRETLVLKRLYSTPIRKGYIILGEGIAKVIFQLVTVVVLILFGYFVYQFTLANGFRTFVEMLLLSFFALLVFMGFGFFISGVSKNQNVIPIYANLFMFPQYFLSGTFFPKTSLPLSVQSVIQYLPLTATNDAMRNIAFEGASLASCWPQLLILLVWGIAIYALTIKVFRWE
jgi:ABC-2 type transport system permease protein